MDPENGATFNQNRFWNLYILESRHNHTGLELFVIVWTKITGKKRIPMASWHHILRGLENRAKCDIARFQAMVSRQVVIYDYFWLKTGPQNVRFKKSEIF